MAEGSILRAGTIGIDSLATKPYPSLVEDNQVTSAENTVFDNKGIVIRNGSKVFKNNTQWGANPAYAGTSYNLDKDGAEIALLISTGTIYYQKVATISADPTVVLNPTVTWNSVSTALTISNKNECFMKVLNNKVFIVSGQNMIKYYGTDHVLKTVPDPAGYEVTFTVGSGVAATIDAVYQDAADTSRQFNIELTKTAGTGTTLIARQIAGDTRPAASGTLTKVTGPGDASIAFTAVAYTGNYISLATRGPRLVAILDNGDVAISEPNNGTNFAGTQSEIIPYGKVDGMQVVNATDFKRGTILGLVEETLQKASTAILTGYRKYDTDTPNRTDGLFNIERESDMIAIFGRSGLEVGNGFIGLTKNGFIDFAALDSSSEFGITDAVYISNDINDIINTIDWNYSAGIRACLDENNQRYWCAVPPIGSTSNSLVLVYDFKRSYRAVRNLGASHKWSLFTFSIGERTIETMFTVFGHPFLCLSDGTILIAEMKSYYFDDGNAYPSSITTKFYDFGSRLKTKKWKRGIIDLINDEEVPLEVFSITDGNHNTRDWNNKLKKEKLLKPKNISEDDLWTLENSDVWTLNPLDIWGRFTALRNSLVVTRVPNFREVGFVIRNTEGGKKWGCYGYELEATESGDWVDTRFRVINKALSSHITQALLPLIPYWGMIVGSFFI